MPRISELEKLKRTARDELTGARGRLNARTSTAYLERIYRSDRKDVIRKIIAELQAVRAVQGAVNLKVADIKRIGQAAVELARAPRQVDESMDRINFYTRLRMSYDNVNNMRDLYRAINDAIARRMNNAQFIILHLVPRGEDNRVRSITLRRTDIELGFEAFLAAIDKIATGKFVGSDPIDYAQDEIVLNRFDIANTQIAQQVQGSSDKMMFKVNGIEQTKFEKAGKTFPAGDCGKLCLKAVISNAEVLADLEKRSVLEFRSLDGLLHYIEMWALKINVIANSFVVKKPVNDIMKSGETKVIEIADRKKKGMMRQHICRTLTLDEDIEVVYFKQLPDATATIIYDEFNQHFDVVMNNKIELDDVCITYESNIVKGGEIIFTPKELNKNNRKKADVESKSKFVFFDYETIIDFKKNCCMQEYSISILVLDNEQLEKLTEADKQNNIEEVSKIRKQCCTTFLGLDCSTQFIKWILENGNDTFFTFVGFNNANFDNFIFLDALLRFTWKEVQVSDIFYNGSQLLNFKVMGRHGTFDIHKHLMGSLKANCESFKINCCAKKPFDHNKAQQLHESGELINFITCNEELKEYNEFDVLATAVLFCKYREALRNIEATKPYADDMHITSKTIGSLIYRVFEASKEKKKFELPKLSFKQYSDLQKCKIAGRVELFNGVMKVLERLVSTDVCSLYPYVMAVLNVFYPCGKIIDTDEYRGDDVLGFYYCNIDQSNLRAMNLPKIYARKTEIENDWGHEEVLEDYLISNVMIGLLKKFGCGVVIKKGFYFTEKKKSCDMFDFLLDFMKAKNEQDTLSKKKDASYNPALRETLKLLMNSLSGKVIEGLHTEKTTDVNSVAEYEKIKQKCTAINFINSIGDKLFITYEVDAESICQKAQRPIYLGVYIYDYAKRYMYENSYSKVGLNELLYTDTDASKFRYSKFLEWKQWIDKENVQVPHWEEVELVDARYKNHKIYDANSKVFGSFEDELSGMVGTEYVFYCVEKKSWCYSVDGKAKFRFKGLNGSALMLTLGEDFISEKTIKHKDGSVETKFQIRDDCEKKVYNFANDNKHLAIKNENFKDKMDGMHGNEVKFFEQIYSTKEAYVLCNSFRKIVKNSLRNVDLGQDDKYNKYMNKIQVSYMMKHISLKK